MNLNTIDNGILAEPGRAAVREQVRRRLADAWRTAHLWWRRQRERAELRALLAREPRFFADIGVSRATVYNESRKWFWQD